MVYGGNPVELRPLGALAAGDGHERHVAELREQRLQVGKVEPAVQRRHGARGQRAKQREMQRRLDVKMQHVELPSPLAHALQHQDLMRPGIAHTRVQAQRPGRAGHERGAGLRIGAGEERDLVAEPHQLLGKIRNHALRATMEPGRDALGEWSDLCDLHAEPAGRLQGLCRDRGLL